MRRLVCLTAVLLVAACSGGGGGAKNVSYAGKTLQLGAVLSLTGAGKEYGVQSKNGMTLAVEQINASGGINGGQINLTVSDDTSDRTTATARARTLIQQGQVLALLGPTLTDSAAAVHPLAENLKVPVIGVSNAGTHIVPDCKYPDETPCKYVFRDSLGEDAAIADNIKSYVSDAHPKTGVLLEAQDDTLSSDDGKIVQNSASRHGINLLKTILFSKNDADLAKYVTQAVQLNPDVIFIMSPAELPARIMVEARNQGWQGVFLGGNGFNAAKLSKQAGAAGYGARCASGWYIGNSSTLNRDFVNAYRSQFNMDPDAFAAQAYTGIEIIADAAKRARLTFSEVATDRDRLRAALETVNIETPLGPFQFTPKHDVKQTVWIIAMDGAGGFTPVHEITS